MKKRSRKKILFGIFVNLCLFGIGFVVGNSIAEQKVEVRYENVLVYKDIPEISDKTIYDLCYQCNIKFPRIVVAQARLETGNYTSGNFTKNNNLFGMKSNRRFTVGEPNGTYQSYRDWTMSVIDYGIWQHKNMPRRLETEDEYLLWLETYSYAEDSLYTQKLKTISNSLSL